MSSSGPPAAWPNVDDDPRSLLIALRNTVLDTILVPFRVVTSKSARRTYIATALLGITAAALFAFAVVAYVLFYTTFLPRAGFERTVFLQFDNVFVHDAAPGAMSPHDILATSGWRRHPYGSVALAPDLVSAQAYDVTVDLILPRTRENLDAGNFMLEVGFYGEASGAKPGVSPPWLSGQVLNTLQAETRPSQPDSTIAVVPIAVSRRAAILPYRSYLVELLHRASELHWYLLGLRSETTAIRIPVFEGIAFRKNRNRPWRNPHPTSAEYIDVPSTLRLELQSSHRLQIYSAKVMFRARFTGVRWLMHNHRILAAFVFINAFWFTEIVFTFLTWAVLAYLAATKSRSTPPSHIKSEPGPDQDPAPFTAPSEPAALSDTERTFPTLRGQAPLRYPATPAPPGPAPDPVLVRTLEADDEAVSDLDDDDDFAFRDSGIGTSLESAGPARRGSLRRRQRGREPERFHEGETGVKKEEGT